MKNYALLAVIVFMTQFGFSQKMDLASGTFSALKNQTKVNVEFNYSNLKMMKENMTEQEYVDNRAKELNEKNTGNGDVWKKKWENAKEGIWEPKFMELLLKGMKKSKMVFVQNDQSCKYTLYVDVVWIYPGWDTYVMKQPAKVTMEIKLFETENRDKALAVLSTKEAPGDQYGNNFSNESRIGEGFAKTAKSLTKLILKHIK